MAGQRFYDDPCGLARALDLVGERWALLVVRELLLGPKRFTDLRAGLPGASQNVLAQRLRQLSEAGIVEQVRLGPPASTSAYRLTDRGRDLEPAVLALASWGSRGAVRSTAGLSPDALALALRTTFDPAAAAGRSARVLLRLDGQELLAEVSGGGVRVERSRGGDHDAAITADTATLRSVVFGGAAVDALEVEGDQSVVGWFVRVFPRPAPVQGSR